MTITLNYKYLNRRVAWIDAAGRYKDIPQWAKALRFNKIIIVTASEQYLYYDYKNYYIPWDNNLDRVFMSLFSTCTLAVAKTLVASEKAFIDMDCNEFGYATNLPWSATPYPYPCAVSVLQGGTAIYGNDGTQSVLPARPVSAYTKKVLDGLDLWTVIGDVSKLAQTAVLYSFDYQIPLQLTSDYGDDLRPDATIIDPIQWRIVKQ